MRTLLVVLIAAVGTARAQAPAGAVRSDRASIEVLPPRAAGAEIRTPEGFIRAEGPPPSSAAAGSFGVYAGGAYARAAPPPPGPEGGVPNPAAVSRPGGRGGAEAGAGPDRCRSERTRYLRRLLRMEGVDVDDPIAFLEGLAGPAPYPGALLFSAYGLLPGVDPIQPLAWDFELRSLARDLAACASGDATRPR